MRTGVLAGLGALLLAAALVGASGAPAAAEPGKALLAALAVGALLSELSAVALPGFGFYSPAFAFYFALALLPAPGMQFAVLAAVGGLVLRTATRGHELGAWRLREAVGDLFPVGAGLAALHFVNASGLGAAAAPLEVRIPAVLAGLAVYVFAAMTVPGLFVSELSPENSMSWGMVRERLWAALLALPAAGFLMAALAVTRPAWLLAVLPLLVALHRSAAIGSFWARVEERRRLERRLDTARGQLTEVEESQRRTRKDLVTKVDEYSLLEGLASTLAGCESRKETYAAVIAMVKRLVPCQSVVIFMHGRDGLLPAGWDTPHAERLASFDLLQLQEPVVERAWRERKAVHARVDEMRESQAIPDERSRLAVAIPKQGVLYVGNRSADTFREEHVRVLGIIAGQAGLALQSTSRLESREESLVRHSKAHKRLDAWAHKLEQALGGVRELLSSLEPSELLAQLGTLLTPLAPHDLRVIVAGNFRVAEGAEDAQAVDEVVEVVRRNGLPLLLEDVATTRFQPPGEGMRSVLAVPLVTDEGVVGAIVLGARQAKAFGREHQDLSFMLAYQAAAAFRNAELHRELRESQAALIQSSKMAAVGQLAAGVAHELNTPLGAILLGLDSALPVIETKPQRAVSRLETARRAVMQAREIVAKLLFYSRDARQGFRDTDLNQVVDDTLEILGHHLRMDDIEIVKDYAEVPSLFANQNELQQVLTNLILNARDAMLAEGTTGPHRIRLGTRPDGPGSALIEVEDTGPGIPQEVRDRIFEPFFTTKPVGKGTGLGLSVSLEIVKRHGGTIEVASEAGAGTKFTVHLGSAPPPPAEP